MQTFAALAAEGRGVVVALHDLGLAARHCTRLVLMDRGRVIADGTPRDVLTPALMAQVFGVSVFTHDTGAGTVFQPMEVLR
jgi:iron complex transport system ATP-binding protein